MPQQTDIDQLIRASEQARGVLAARAVELRCRLDVPARIRTSLFKHPSAWFGGSLATGFLAANFLRRKPKTPKPRKGLLGFLLTLAIAAGRPAVKIWLTGRLKQFLGSTLQNQFPRPARSRDIR